MISASKAAHSKARVAIIGGGITGLAAAYELTKTTDAEIDLYEASDRLGGKVGTSRLDGMIVEGGPDCFFAAKPGAMELVRELGLEDELISPQQKEFSMLVGGGLHPVPAGLVRLASPDPEAIRQVAFLSAEGKARALREPEQPAGTATDESIRSFFSRRFGPEFSRLVAEPLLAGTHGGDPDRLSMRALYPNYFCLESGDRPTAAPASTKPTFLSFRNGMQTLIDGLTARLGRTRVHLASRPSLEELRADRILIALPAPAAASLMDVGCRTASSALRAIPHRSSAIVTLGFRSSGVRHELNGTGFLVPQGESETITGATWSSRKWEHRAPEGQVLMRVFLGGDRDALMAAPDDRLLASAMAGIREVLETPDMPNFSRVTRWIDALPQYELGHEERLAAVESAMQDLPHVHLAGTSFRGVGVPDCLRQGREAAKKIAEAL